MKFRSRGISINIRRQGRQVRSWRRYWRLRRNWTGVWRRFLMFKLPLIRVDSLEYLQKMQAGELFMRNSLYYQALEQDDSVRSDPFDGSLPIEGVVDIPFMKSKDSLIHEPRVMTGNTFIKCFYNYSDRDCKKISQEEYSLTISDDSMSEINYVQTGSCADNR